MFAENALINKAKINKFIFPQEAEQEIVAKSFQPCRLPKIFHIADKLLFNIENTKNWRN